MQNEHFYDALSSIAAFLSVAIAMGTFVFLYLHRLKDRRAQIFYDLFRQWNSEFMQNKRHELYHDVFDARIKAKPDEKIALYELSKTEFKKYSLFETVHDFFHDVAVLYDQNLIDKKLVKLLLGVFIKRYYERLETYYLFADEDLSPEAINAVRDHPKLARTHYALFRKMYLDTKI